MQSKRVFAIVFFVLALIFLVLGIAQIVLFVSPQTTMLAGASAQGATSEEISAYIWEQLLPQVFSFVINSFGITAILAGIGLLLWGSKRNKQLESLLANHSSKQAQSAPVVAETPAVKATASPAVTNVVQPAVATKPAAISPEKAESENDFFKDFEIVENAEKKKAEPKVKEPAKKPAPKKAEAAEKKPKSTPKKPTAKPKAEIKKD